MSLTVDALKKLHDNGLFAVPAVVPPPVDPAKPQNGTTESSPTHDRLAHATVPAEANKPPAAYNPVIHPFEDLRPSAPAAGHHLEPDASPAPRMAQPTWDQAQPTWDQAQPTWDQLPPDARLSDELSPELPPEPPAAEDDADDYDLLLPEPEPDWMELPAATTAGEMTDDLHHLETELPPVASAAEAAPPVVPTYEQSVLDRLSQPDYAQSFLRLWEGVQSRCGSSLPASLLTVSPHATSRSAELIIHLALVWGGAEQILLVDANLQEQTLTRSLNALGQPGFCDVLSSMSRPEDVVRTTSLPRLHFVPCGDDQTGVSHPRAARPRSAGAHAPAVARSLRPRVDRCGSDGSHARKASGHAL